FFFIFQMLAKTLFLVSAVALCAQALKCLHQATTKQHLVEGNYDGPVTIPIDIGSYECEKGLDRCATFVSCMIAPMSTTDLLRTDGGKQLNQLALFALGGTVEGTSCFSQKDCATMNAIQGDNGCKTKQTCCCKSDNCADYNNSSVSVSFLSVLVMVLALVMMKH
ncbi:hypothetical protein PENTCL1PPCAC_5208, partial [Pristionchus entomophagus]